MVLVDTDNAYVADDAVFVQKKVHLDFSFPHLGSVPLLFHFKAFVCHPSTKVNK